MNDKHIPAPCKERQAYDNRVNGIDNGFFSFAAVCRAIIHPSHLHNEQKKSVTFLPPLHILFLPSTYSKHVHAETKNDKKHTTGPYERSEGEERRGEEEEEEERGACDACLRVAQK